MQGRRPTAHRQFMACHSHHAGTRRCGHTRVENFEQTCNDGKGHTLLCYPSHRKSARDSKVRRGLNARSPGQGEYQYDDKPAILWSEISDDLKEHLHNAHGIQSEVDWNRLGNQPCSRWYSQNKEAIR